MNAKLFSEAITEVDNKYYEEAATYDYRVDNEVDTYSRAFALRRKLKTVLIAAVIMALAFSTVAAAAYLYHVFIANRHTELPSYEVGAKVEPKTISAYALEELKVKPYQTYKATYGEAEKYLDVDLLISEQLENTIFGQGVDIQGSYLKGENPITSVTLYSRHDTGATMSGYIDMSVYVSIGTSDTYQQIAQILNPELMEKDAILSEYVSETNGIAAKFAVYDTIGRASAYFVNDGILYNISVHSIQGTVLKTASAYRGHGTYRDCSWEIQNNHTLHRYPLMQKPICTLTLSVRDGLSAHIPVMWEQSFHLPAFLRNIFF